MGPRGYYLTRSSSLVPALAVALPLFLSDLAWAQSHHDTWSSLFGLGVTGALTFFLAMMAHHIGKRRESVLEELWGEEPTARALRHGTSAEKTTAERHRRLEKTILGLRMPTSTEEAADPRAAEQVYRQVASFLHERARIRGSLAHEELCRYRLRRNLWGLRPLGMGTAILSLAIAATLIALNRVSRDGGFSAAAAVLAFLSLGLLLGWSFWVTQDWVRFSAEKYAEKILTVSEDL